MRYLLLFVIVHIHFAGVAQERVTHRTSGIKNELPHVAITEFKLFNQQLPVDSLNRLGNVTLTHDHNTFSISFAATGFPPPDTMRYFYKLDGADKDWVQAAKPSTVNYTLLPPGRYTFSVKGQSIKGGIVTPVTEMTIFIKLPFWLSWWFILLCCVVFTGIIYYFHRLSVNRILAIEAVRQKVARDLHDDMGSTLSTINILSLMAKNKLGEDPVKTSEFLTKISDNSSRMMEAMDDIVWSINPANDSMDKTVARMRSFATEVLEAKDMDLAFFTDPAVEAVSLDMEQRRDLFLIFKEIVNNAAKYSHATQVSIRIALEKSFLQLTIEDNGVGFVLEEADSGNGLNNMQRRATLLNGKINIQSQPGNGTAIHLQIPVS